LKRVIVFIWVQLILLIGGLEAKDFHLTIEDNDHIYNPSPFASILIDQENTFILADILSPDLVDSFHPYQDEVVKLSTMNSSIWLRFKVQNLSSHASYLEIKNAYFDSAEYFLINDTKLIHYELLGNAVYVRDNRLKISSLLFDMQLVEDAIYTCYIRLKPKQKSVQVPIRIATLESFYKLKHRENLWQGIYFGLIIFLIIYNAFLFISINDTSYLYFGLFVTFTGLLFSLYSSVGKELIWDNLPYWTMRESVVGTLTSTAMILFSSRFLNSKRKTPKIHLWLLALILINIPFLAIGLFGLHTLSTQLIFYNSVMSLLFLMFLAVKSWSSGYQPAKFYLIAWSFHVGGVVLSLMMETSVLSIELSIPQVLQVSSAISIFFMSFALSKKINVYIQTRNAAQQLALKTVMENEKLVFDQNQLLEARVHQRTIDLEQTISSLSKQRKDLQDANSFKDKVFSIISHDLKSPISSLAGLLQIMKMKTLNEEERSHAITSLEIALKGTKNLLDNVLAWASKNQKIRKETEEIELGKLINEVFEVFQFQAEKKEIELKNLIEKDFHIITNKDMLQLVLRNLVSNALKFTTKDGTVEVGMRQDFLNVEIFVKDSGVGMSESIVSNLFKSNKHNSTRGTDNEKGTGLGLILCKEFAEKHNGTLHVTSQLNVGTTFTLHLSNAIPIVETVFS